MRNVEEVKPAKITSAEHENTRNSSCTIYVLLFSIFFTIKKLILKIEHITYLMIRSALKTSIQT